MVQGKMVCSLLTMSKDCEGQKDQWRGRRRSPHEESTARKIRRKRGPFPADGKRTSGGQCGETSGERQYLT